jgi:redox-sensitive bicupin YhaK (pirin superfamily)
VPVVALADGVEVRVIAGTLINSVRVIDGEASPQCQPLAAAPLYLDVRLPPTAHFEQALANTRSAFVYVYDGDATIDGRAVPNRAAGVHGARLLVLAARPLGERIVQYGPFVMNTREKIEQAIHDYQSGGFGKAA